MNNYVEIKCFMYEKNKERNITFILEMFSVCSYLLKLKNRHKRINLLQSQNVL